MPRIDFSEIKNGVKVVCGDNKIAKVVEVKTSAPGKHGHAKKNVTLIDIFDGNKYNELYTHHSIINAPDIKQQEYEVMDMDEDGYLSLLDENGETREDLKVSEGDLKDQIEKFMQSEKGCIVSCVNVMINCDMPAIHRVLSAKKG